MEKDFFFLLYVCAFLTDQQKKDGKKEWNGIQLPVVWGRKNSRDDIKWKENVYGKGSIKPCKKNEKLRCHFVIKHLWNFTVSNIQCLIKVSVGKLIFSLNV